MGGGFRRSMLWLPVRIDGQGAMTGESRMAQRRTDTGDTMHRFQPGPSYDSAKNLVASESFRGESYARIEDIERQHLADILTIEDCFARRAMHGAPILLRFEQCDIAVTVAKNGGLSIWRGTVDTSARIEMFSCDSPLAQDNDRFCLAWTVVSEATSGIGQVVSGVSFDMQLRDKDSSPENHAGAASMAPIDNSRKSSETHYGFDREKPSTGHIAKIDATHEVGAISALAIDLKENVLRIECHREKTAITLQEATRRHEKEPSSP